MSHKSFQLLLFSLISLSLCAKTIDISKIESDKHLAPHAYLLEDPEHQYDYKDILNNSFEGDFFQSNSNVPYMDFTTSTYWMKLKVSNESNQEQRFYIELARPLTNVVNLYIIDQKGDLVEHFESGDAKIFDERTFQDRRFVFPVNFAP
jgi:hypothetical protein